MSKEPPVCLVKRKPGCANRLIEVFLDDIEGEKGEIVHDYIVLAPRQKADNNVTGVAILPVLNGAIGLLHIYRHPIGGYTWEVPRGFIDAGEKAAISALRELEEETGLQCDINDVVDLGTALPEPGVMTARTQLFAATRCRETGPYKANELGHEELRFFSSDEINDMARQGIIEDANTLAICYRFFLSLE
ncbi:MAG: NUDIX hydrolase [Sulfuricaulis sp.]